LDVTKPDEIRAAVKTVREAGRGLYGLINNAGVAVVGPLIEMRESLRTRTFKKHFRPAPRPCSASRAPNATSKHAGAMVIIAQTRWFVLR